MISFTGIDRYTEHSFTGEWLSNDKWNLTFNFQFIVEEWETVVMNITFLKEAADTDYYNTFGIILTTPDTEV